MKTAGNAKRRQLENGNSSNYKSIQTRHPFSAFRQQLCTLRRSSLPQPQIFCVFTDVSLDVVRFWYAWASTNQAELDRTRTENCGVKNASTKCWPLIHGGLQSHTSQAPPQYWLVRSSSAFFFASRFRCTKCKRKKYRRRKTVSGGQRPPNVLLPPFTRVPWWCCC